MTFTSFSVMSMFSCYPRDIHMQSSTQRPIVANALVTLNMSNRVSAPSSPPPSHLFTLLCFSASDEAQALRTFTPVAPLPSREVMLAPTVTAGWEQVGAPGRACCLSPDAHLGTHQKPPWASLIPLNVIYMHTCTHMDTAGTEMALRTVRGRARLC